MRNPLAILADRERVGVHLTILVFLATLALVVPAGLWDIRGPDEGRYTEVAKELLGRDNWFALTVMGMPYDQKPPLMFWMLAGAIKLSGGICSWALRMPSVLAAIGMLVMTYFLGRRFAGARAGFLSGFFLLTSISFLDDAPVVELNMVYGFFIVAAVVVWLMRMDEDRLSWPAWAVMWLSLGAAFLVKGPLAILIVLSALGGAAYARRTWQPFLATRALAGLVLVVVIIVGWLYMQSRAWGAQFVEEQVSSETVNRFLKGDHEESFFYYFPRMFSAVMGPWTCVLIVALMGVWHRRGTNPRWVAPLVGWMTVPFIILLLANGKRVPYLVPLLTPACVLSGIWAHENLAGCVSQRWFQKVLLTLLVVVGAALALAGVAFMVPETWIKNPDYDRWIDFDRFWPAAWFIASVMIAVLAWLFWKSERRWVEGFWALGLAILLVHTLDMVAVRPALDPGKSTRQFGQTIDRLLAERGESTLLSMPELAEPEFHVYGNYKLKYGKRRELDLTNPDLPSVLALKQKEIRTSETTALAAGYRKIIEMDVTKKPVVIYVRD